MEDQRILWLRKNFGSQSFKYWDISKLMLRDLKGEKKHQRKNESVRRYIQIWITSRETWRLDSLTVLVREGSDSEIYDKLPFTDYGNTTYKRTVLTDGQTSGNPFPQGGMVQEKKRKVDPSRGSPHLGAAFGSYHPGCHPACQRRSPLSSRSTGPKYQWLCTSCHSISNGRTGRRRRRKSSIAAVTFFFALRAVLVFRTYFCRGFCAPSSASKRATLPAPNVSAARRIIISGFDLYYH